ncbi:hypothetical protein MRBLMN1_004335 [Chitinophaga ginsengisegetis]|uniref:hypothetical protein n=1 Tax=Chitinophaga ginsengisegetis TaxID=393003 RepID=UPI003413E01C
MGRTQHFFEYQAMLASEYADLDPQRLLRLGAMVARNALASVTTPLASAKYSPYQELLELTVDTLSIAGNDLRAPRPPVIDQCQKELTAAHSKFSRKSKVVDEGKKQLADCTALLLQVIYYLKTEDPLYIIGMLDAIHRLDTHVLAGYQDQLALIARLKKFLKI